MTFLDASFPALDGLRADALVLFVHEDERPLRGLLGMADWRLCGALSAVVREGQITGRLGERVLMPSHGRVGAPRIFLFGAGARSKSLAGEALAEALRVVCAAGARVLALELPANLEPGASQGALAGFDGDELCVFGAPPALRARFASGEGRRRSGA